MKITIRNKHSVFITILFLLGTKLLPAQVLSVGSETEMTIVSGTEFSFDNLILLPSKTYSIKDNILELGSHTSFLNGNSINKNYHFLREPLPFSGITEFRFNDRDLNGLEKSSLKIQILENNGWHGMDSKSNSHNAISSSPAFSIIPKEITLGNKDHVADFVILSNPVLNNSLTLQVNKQGHFSLFTNDGKLLQKQYFQEGIHTIDLHRYANSIYLISSEKNTKKFIL